MCWVIDGGHDMKIVRLFKPHPTELDQVEVGKFGLCDDGKVQYWRAGESDPISDAEFRLFYGKSIPDIDENDVTPDQGMKDLESLKYSFLGAYQRVGPVEDE